MSGGSPSPSRILAIAGNTFTDLVRQKVFLFLLIFSLMVIGCSSFLARFSFQEEFQMLKDVSLGAMSLFLSFLAILASAMLLPRDLEDRTIFTILSKPVPRHEYLLGKLFGVLYMLLLSTLLLGGLFLAVLLLREQSVLLETRNSLASSPRELDSALAEIRQSAFNWNLIPAMGILFVKSSLIASLTLMISTFATSGLFAILISSSVYFIGHLQETAREYWLGGIAVHWWSRLSAALLALVFPDLQAFNLSDDIVAGKGIPMDVFWQTVALGVLYTAIYYLAACFVFQKREL